MMLSVAVPTKGRLREPSLRLLGEAGLSFEVTDRALAVPVGNAPVELLLVRTEDVTELVADRVADLGITGVDLLHERPQGLATLAHLGYGTCRLVAAVPAGSPAEDLADLAGMRIATAHPVTTAGFFHARSIPVTVVPLRGSVEVATKLGVADGIVDLVSTGSTLRVNGLRPVGTLLESEAVLVGREGEGSPEAERVATALRAVVAARRKRYLLLNAPVGTAEEIERLIPGLEAPTVMPLAEEGWVAIHSVIGTDQVWDLLPRLRAAGARGILVLPIEQLIA